MSLQSQPKISWPDLVFFAEAEQEEFATVQIITLYSHCLNLTEEQNKPISTISEAEQVRIYPELVLIIIDEQKIDDDVTMEALNFLTQMDSFEVGTVKEFGPKKTFTHRREH